MEARIIFERLTRFTPVNLADLPKEFGVYALWDHERQIRYIGSTPKVTEGFRTRIYSEQATGSEGRSHKFTQAYCAGRMWRYCKKLDDPVAAREQLTADADAAKKLRNAFIRKYCAATYVSILPSSLPSLISQALPSWNSSFRQWGLQACGLGRALGFAAYQSQPFSWISCYLSYFTLQQMPPHRTQSTKHMCWVLLPNNSFKPTPLGGAA